MQFNVYLVSMALVFLFSGFVGRDGRGADHRNRPGDPYPVQRLHCAHLQHSLASRRFIESKLQDMTFNEERVRLSSVDGTVIQIRDVAFVHDEYQPQQNIVPLNEVLGVLLTILKSGTASTLDVVNGVKAAMPRILSGLPPELNVREFADQSIFVRAAISSVLKEGLIAAALTALMILCSFWAHGEACSSSPYPYRFPSWHPS